MNDSRTLVEHFFRHEYGRLVAMLTRSFGIRNLELIEDVVQSTLSNAIQSWGQKGIPERPGAWLYKSSRNLAIDALRRKQIESRLLHGVATGQIEADETEPSAPSDEDVGDESLRLLFLCCHPGIPLESSVAIALKTVSGFSTEEVGSALMISHASVEKRISRAKERLREMGTEIAELDASAIASRVDAVQSTIYLLFNEGYASLSSEHTLRKDLCDEAIRLARMLIHSIGTSSPSSSALIALMLMHLARFDARMDKQGSLILLEDQDRLRWDWNLIREAMEWMARSAVGDQLSRYHLEAAIAWEHCRAKRFLDIDWPKIAGYYRLLLQMHPSPMIQLNLAIANSYAIGLDFGLMQLSQISGEHRSRLRPWWDCAIAELFFRLGRTAHAIAHWEDAILLANNSEQRELISKQLAKAKKAPLI